MSNIIQYPTGEDRYVGREFVVGATTKVWDGSKWVNKSFGNHELRIQDLEEGVSSNYTRRVQNIDELKALEIDDSMVGNLIKVNEYHAGTGYGGGEWEVVTGEEANNIDIVQSSHSAVIQFELVKKRNTEITSYGAIKGDSDSSPQIQRSIDSVNMVNIPSGTFSHSGFKYKSYTKIIGRGRQASTLVALNAGARIDSIDSSVRGYDLEISKLSISGGGVVDVCLSLQSMSSANFFNLVIYSATSIGIEMETSIFGGSVYNAMIDVTVQSCPVGLSISTLNCNDTKFIGGRINNCSDTGVYIFNSNHTIITASQIELCGTGVKLRADSVGLLLKTTISDTRFENNTVNWDIGEQVADTTIIAPMEVTGTSVDNGDRTNVIAASPASQNKQSSQRQDENGSWLYQRVANGGSQTPAHVVDDKSSINSPVQYEARCVSTSKDSRFYRAKFGANPKFGVSAPYGVIVDLGTTNGPVGAITTGDNPSATVNNLAVNAGSLIQVTPLNSIAAQDVAAKGVYVSKVADTSITLHTGDSTNFTSGGVYSYFFVN